MRACVFKNLCLFVSISQQKNLYPRSRTARLAASARTALTSPRLCMSTHSPTMPTTAPTKAPCTTAPATRRSRHRREDLCMITPTTALPRSRGTQQETHAMSLNTIAIALDLALSRCTTARHRTTSISTVLQRLIHATFGTGSEWQEVREAMRMTSLLLHLHMLLAGHDDCFRGCPSTRSVITTTTTTTATRTSQPSMRARHGAMRRVSMTWRIARTCRPARSRHCRPPIRRRRMCMSGQATA